MKKPTGSGATNPQPLYPIVMREDSRLARDVLGLEIRGEFLRRVRDAERRQTDEKDGNIDPVLRSHLGLDPRVK